MLGVNAWRHNFRSRVMFCAAVPQSALIRWRECSDHLGEFCYTCEEREKKMRLASCWVAIELNAMDKDRREAASYTDSVVGEACRAANNLPWDTVGRPVTSQIICMFCNTVSCFFFYNFVVVYLRFCIDSFFPLFLISAFLLVSFVTSLSVMVGGRCDWVSVAVLAGGGRILYNSTLKLCRNALPGVWP